MLQNIQVMARKLRIGFDARMIAYRQAGIGQYNLNLLRELVALQASEDFELVVFQSRKEKRPPESWLELNNSLPPPRKRVLWTPPHHRWEQQALLGELALARLDVFHSPDFIPPLRRYTLGRRGLRKFSSVITIHDLAFMHFPHLLTAESSRYYGQVREAAQSAERIIAVSQSTARDITEQLQIAPDKIRVVYEAANPLFRPLSGTEVKTLENHGAARIVNKLQQAFIQPEDSFLLFVSTIEPRKNLSTLLWALRQLVSRRDFITEERIKLVIAGREGWLYEDVFRLAEELKLPPYLCWLGEITTDELLYLYNRAAVLAVPSLYEGFGLPPLEALACGCPVAVADVSSLPEVVGTVGRKLPAEDSEAWADALFEIWHNRVNYKAQVLQDGPQFAQTFSWKRAAAETLEVYREAARMEFAK